MYLAHRLLHFTAVVTGGSSINRSSSTREISIMFRASKVYRGQSHKKWSPPTSLPVLPPTSTTTQYEYKEPQGVHTNRHHHQKPEVLR